MSGSSSGPKQRHDEEADPQSHLPPLEVRRDTHPNLLILDGGGNTTLPIEFWWNPFTPVLSPAEVLRVHRQYADAGSRVITTLSYSTTPWTIRNVLGIRDLSSLSKKARGLIRRINSIVGRRRDCVYWAKVCTKSAIRLALRVGEEKNVRVAISVPPQGESYAVGVLKHVGMFDYLAEALSEMRRSRHPASSWPRRFRAPQKHA